LDLQLEAGGGLEDVLSSSLPPKLEKITLRAESVTSLHPATFKVREKRAFFKGILVLRHFLVCIVTAWRSFENLTFKGLF
jgi:hypothetical protein